MDPFQDYAVLKKGNPLVMILLGVCLFTCLETGRTPVLLTFGKSRRMSQGDVVIGTVAAEQVQTDRMHHLKRGRQIFNSSNNGRV